MATMKYEDLALIFSNYAHWGNSTVDYDVGCETMRTLLARAFADAFVYLDPGFDPNKFLAECEVLGFTRPS